MSLFSELRRRNVFKVAFVYVIGSALVLWFAMIIEKQAGLSRWFSELILLLLVLGLPGALIFAWVYEITPGGLKKAVDVDQTQSIVFKTGQKLNAALSVLIVLAAVAMIADRLLPELAHVEETPLEAISKNVPAVPELVEQLEAPAGANVPPEIRSFTLDNGLKFIVWPDHDIPNVVFYNFVRAGGRNEVPGITGLSHFFEHMMFNGTENVPPGDFDNIMEAAGGANNGYTTNDVTVYLDVFPRSALNTIFALESDRMANLAIDPEVVENERGTVYSERRLRVDNDNFGKLREQMIATAYIAHPYQFPVIGWPSDIEAWTQEDLESYFRTYYAPNNSLIVVSGDVTAEEAWTYATTYFDEIPSQEPPAAVRTVEPAQLGQRRFSIVAPAQTPLLHMAFHAGSAADPETLPMALLLNILTAGDSSRLHRLLVEEEQLAISVGAYQEAGFDPGLAYFYLTLPPDGDPQALESRIFEVFADIAANGVSEAELGKAQNIVLADFWRDLATIYGKAEQLGEFETFLGSYEKLFDLPANIEAVTVEQIRSVAESVLRQGNSTVGVLLPEPTDTGNDE